MWKMRLSFMLGVCILVQLAVGDTCVLAQMRLHVVQYA